METKDTWWNQTPLSWAAKRGHEAVVRLLVKKGTDIDAKDNEGQTALLWAAKRGYEGIVKFLIENGADATAKSTNGQTALSCAMKVGHTAVAQLLHSRLKTGNGATS
jgi:ankyrin repeat protein